MPTLYCPECGYNLTGLTENRCPECGERFDPKQLEKELEQAGKVIRRIRIKMFLFPLLFAVLMPCWFHAPASLGNRSPQFWILFNVLIAAIPTLLPPLWLGWALGKQYARAKLILTPPDRAERNIRPDWQIALYFSIGQTIMMFLYLGLLFLIIGTCLYYAP